MLYNRDEDDSEFARQYRDLQLGNYDNALFKQGNPLPALGMLPGYTEAQRDFGYHLPGPDNGDAVAPVALSGRGAIDDHAELAKSNFLRSEKAGYETGDFDKRDLSRTGDTMTALFKKNYGYTPSAGELIQYANLNGMGSPHDLAVSKVINSPDIDSLHQVNMSRRQLNEFLSRDAYFTQKRIDEAAHSDPLTNGYLWKSTQTEKDGDPNYVKAKLAERLRNSGQSCNVARQYGVPINGAENEAYFPVYLPSALVKVGSGASPDVQDVSVSRSPQTAGQGMLGIWDALQRDQYKKAITDNSKKAVGLVNAAALANDIEAANAAAYSASENRAKIRLATREKLSWGGARMSDMIDKSLTPEQYFSKYRPEHPEPFDLARTVADKSGSSRGSIKYLQIFGKVGGVAGTGLGLYTAGRNVYDAPEQLKGQVAAQETGGILGGAGGSTLGAGLGVLGIGALAATPPGWVIGAGILGGAIGGYFGSESGKELGGKVYKWMKN